MVNRQIRKGGLIKFTYYKITKGDLTIRAILETSVFSHRRIPVFKIISMDGEKQLDFIRMKGVDNVEQFMELNYKLLGGKE